MGMIKDVFKAEFRRFFIDPWKQPFFYFIWSIIFVIMCVLQYNEVFGQAPQTLYIAIDSTLNSKMLKRDLECTNWLARINPEAMQTLNTTQVSEFETFCLRMEKSKKRISELWTVVYVNYYDVGSPTGTYPKYRIGKYREWNTFNSQAFSETSYPLRTVEHLYEQWYYQDFVDKRLKRYMDDADKFIKKKHNIYNTWLLKAQQARVSLYSDNEVNKLYVKEMKDKKLTSEYFPKVPHFEEPLKLPYE